MAPEIKFYTCLGSNVRVDKLASLKKKPGEVCITNLK